MEHRKDSWSTWSQTNSNILSLTDGRRKAIFERPTAINETNAGQWPHCFTRFVIHFHKHPYSVLLRIGDDWSICSMDLCQCTDSDRMVYGLAARETTGHFFWRFDIRHLLDLVKWYSHIEGMAERLRIHVFDRWLFQKMHSELAASARTCVLGPNRPDVRNYKLCLKSQVKDFLCLQNVPSETRFQNLLLFWWSFSHSNIIQSSIHICDPSHTFKICRATLAPWFQGR